MRHQSHCSSISSMEMMELGEMGEDGQLPGDHEKWVHDSSIDHQGRAPLRASTGVWRAALFIIAIEFGERLSYFGLATNLIIYLTKVLGQDVKTAAKNVNYWVGVTTVMPLIGGFVADAYLGRFSTVIVSSVVYLAGLSLLTMSQLVPSLKPRGGSLLRLHEVVFFVAMYMISVGTGGHKPSLESFGADQFDDGNAGERRKKMSYFNWWNCGLCGGLLLGVTGIVYIQDNVGWGAADVALTSVMALSLVVFVAGRRVYRFRVPEGSPLTPLARVVAAAVAKRGLPRPSDAGELYEVPRSAKSKQRLLCHTSKLGFLDRAAVVENRHDPAAFEAEKRNPWRLSTVTQVEELKLLLSMVPIWVSSLPFGLCVAQASTFFIKQAAAMNRTLPGGGGGGFEIPPASVYSVGAVGMIFSITIYDKLLVPLLRRARGNERGLTILQRMWIGMALATAAMAVAAAVERERRRRGAALMSVAWMMPQFVMLGVADGFTLVGLQEYFYDQVPDSMRSLGIAFYLSVMGAANFVSSLLITVVDRVTERGGGSGWFAKDLNGSRLDCFYWLLACINGVNLCVFAYLASRYSYKTVQARVGVVACSDGDDDDDGRV